MATVTPPPAYERKRSKAPAVILALFLGLIAGATCFVFFVRQATEGAWNEFATRLTGRTLRIDTSRPTVVSQIQRLARLETVSYTMDKIVEGDREGRMLPEFLTGDKLLLIAHGSAVAGVDLGQLRASDLQINGQSIRVHLPPAEIFTVALDDQKTRVYSRDTGLFVPTDPNLESEVRARAEDNLRQSALTAGILKTAHDNTCTTLHSLLLSLGFTQVACN
jgi:hypothetical protein